MTLNVTTQIVSVLMLDPHRLANFELSTFRAIITVITVCILRQFSIHISRIVEFPVQGVIYWPRCRLAATNDEVFDRSLMNPSLVC